MQTLCCDELQKYRLWKTLYRIWNQWWTKDRREYKSCPTIIEFYFPFPTLDVFEFLRLNMMGPTNPWFHLHYNILINTQLTITSISLSLYLSLRKCRWTYMMWLIKQKNAHRHHYHGHKGVRVSSTMWVHCSIWCPERGWHYRLQRHREGELDFTTVFKTALDMEIKLKYLRTPHIWRWMTWSYCWSKICWWQDTRAIICLWTFVLTA